MAVDPSFFEGVFSGPGEPAPAEPVAENLADLIYFSPGEQVSETRTVGDELGRGLGAGIQETQAGLYGFAQLLGQITGSETIQNYGREGALRNLEQASLIGPELNSLEDVGNVSDFFRFAAGGLGKALPSVGMALTGGGITAAVARKAFMGRLRGAIIADARASLGAEMAGKLGAGEINAAVRAALARPSVHRMLANVTNVSAGLGAAAPGLPIEAGGIVTDLADRGLEAPYTALFGGTLAAALDAAPVARMISRMFPGVPSTVARGFVDDMATALGAQAVMEGSTEAAQEIVAMAALAYHDPDFDPFDKQGLIRIADAATIGALVGAVSGAGSGAVGNVTQRASDTTNRVREGGARLRNHVREQVLRDIGADRPDGVPLIPGWTELRGKVVDGLTAAYQGAVSGLRERAAAGVDAAIQDGNGAPNRSIAALIDSAEEKLRARITPEMERLNARVGDAMTRIRDNARKMAEDQRVQYVRAEFDKLSKQASDFIAERFGRIVSSVESEAAEKFDTENLPDEDSFGFEDDTIETGLEAFTQVEVEPKRVFGQVVHRTYKSGPGEETDPVKVRSRGDEAVPFGSREAAEKAADEIRANYPNVGRDAIQVTEVEKGYLVSIFDEGAGEEIFQQERTNDTLTKAVALARKKDRRTNPRVAEIKRRGATRPTQIDVPTLAFGGRDIAERGGIQVTDDALKAALRGLDTTLARMIDQGIEIVGGIEAIDSRTLINGMTVGEARRRTGRNWTTKTSDQVKASRERELLRGVFRELGDRGDPGDRVANVTIDGKTMKEFIEGGPMQPAFEVQTPEERSRQSEDEQARASARAQGGTPSAANPITRSPSNKNVRVGLLGQSQQLRDRVTQLVSDMAKLTGLANKEFVIVDRKGAEALLASKDFPSQWKAGLLKAMADAENGKTLGSVLHGDGKRKVIFLGQPLFAKESILIRTLMHEMGHVIQRSYFDQLPDNLQLQMRKDHMDTASPLEFNEWMADQFLAWTVRDRKPRNAIERFFARVAKALSNFFNVFQQKYPLSETYQQFIQGVVGVASADANVNEWGRALLALRFKDQGIASKPGKLIVDVNEAVKNLELPPPGFAHMSPKVENLERDQNVIDATDRFRPPRQPTQDDIDTDEYNALFDAYEKEQESLELAQRDREVAGADGNEVGLRRYDKEIAAIEKRIADLEARLDDFEDVPTIENLNVAQARAQARAQWSVIRQRLNQQYPQAMRAAGSVWNAMQRINDQWFTSLNGAIRRMDIPAFNAVADMFNKTPGTAPRGPLYFVEVQKRRAEFATKLNRALGAATEQEIAAAQAELIALNGRPGQHKNPIAQALRGVLDELHTYMVEGGLLMENVPNYWPKIWDHELVKAGEAQIRADLLADGNKPQDIDFIFEHMLEHDGAEASFQRNIHPRAHVAGEPSNSFIKARGKVLTDPKYDQYLSKDTRRTMERYLNAAVKRTEFNRVLGSDARKTGAKNWDPRGKWLDLIKRGQQQGATQEQVEFMNDAMEAMLGRYGRNTPDRVRRMMAWIATYQNLRILGFSQLSSLPDLVGPALRTGEYQQAFSVLRQQMKQITDDQSNLTEAGRVWGIISDTLNQHVLTEHYDTHWFPEGARRLNDWFFRAIGMEKLNNFVRAYALAVGMDFIERRAVAAYNNKDPKAAGDLHELGLTPEDVIDWIAGGRKIYGSAKPTLSTTKPYDERVSSALVTFVNEANMRPNPSSRPLMASHPALMLVWHLKSYMFSFYDVFIRQIVLQAQRAGTPWQKAYVVAVPAAMMLALTAAGLELRELIQYKIWGAEGRTERMTGSEYTWELLQRSGLLGPSQLVVDWEEANERGNAGLVAIGGPTLGQLADAVQQQPSTTLVKAIPGISQFPVLRERLTSE